MDEGEVMLIGFDIHKFVKKICDQFLSDSPDMAEGEKRAYKLGIDNTLSLLEQTLNEMIEDENASFNNIVVHVPDLEVMTEFATIEEVLNREE